MAIDKKFAKESYTGLPGWAKGVIAVAVVGGIGFLIWKLIRVPGAIRDGMGNRQEDRAWTNEAESLSQKATLSKAQLLSLANKLFAAMDGYQTDEAAIYESFRQLKNDADFAGLQAAYGIREISSGSWNPAANFNGNLTAALTDELDSTERQKVNYILSSKKIKYRI